MLKLSGGFVKILVWRVVICRGCVELKVDTMMMMGWDAFVEGICLY